MNVNGLLGNPAFMTGMGLLSNQGNQWGGALQGLAAAQGYKLSEARMKLQQEQEARQKQIEELQLDAAKKAQERQAYTQALLAAASSQNPGLLQDPAFQSQLRQKAAAYGDPKALEAGGLLAPLPTPAEPTTLQRNLAAAGFKEGTPEYQQIVMASLLKPQTAVNVNSGLPKPPAGLMWRDPTQPELGFTNIPGGPQDAEAKKREEAKKSVSEMLSGLYGQYAALRSGGGITSTNNSPTENLLASINRSGPGQAIGSVTGTENQKARESISTMRPLLIQAIKNATGMSAQQMNSEKELMFMIQAATDPSLGYETNIQQLILLDKLYGLGGGFGGGNAGSRPPIDSFRRQ